jgi:thiol-disulfide isomerase/thioredoxin
MKICLSIFTAAAFLLCAAATLIAGPAEWVGKDLPSLGVQYLAKQPDLNGKPAIVEFWATWCPPCRTSIPHLNEIHKKFKDKGLVVIGISDESKDVVEKFQQKTPMEYHVAVGGAEIGKKFGIEGIPHAFIVGKDGKIIWEGHPMKLTDKEIEKALK